MKTLFRLICVMCLGLAVSTVAQERKEVRVLYDFEDSKDLEELKGASENVTFDLVQDNGVTRGKNCCRVVFKQGVDYGMIFLHPSKTKDWGKFDYILFDIFQ